MPPRAQPLHERYVIDEATGCWNWTGCLTAEGYGQLSCQRNGKVTTRKAHRLVYEDIVGPIPDGLTLDHLCRNVRCVNPAHLEPVTATENVRRSPATKLNKLKATEIRALYRTGRFSQLALGIAFGVCECLIQSVVTGEAWVADFEGTHRLSVRNKVGRKQILTDSQVKQLVLRYRSGETQASIARSLGVSVPTICRFVKLNKGNFHDCRYESPSSGDISSNCKEKLGTA